MTLFGWLQSALFVAALVALTKPLGLFIARVFEDAPTPGAAPDTANAAGGAPVMRRGGLADVPVLGRVLGPVERLFYRLAGVRADEEMSWRTYAVGILIFNAAGMLVVYLLQRAQGLLPLNPAGLGAVEPGSAFNTAASFASNTNWQGYGGETTMSYLTQMAALTVQNFASAATGIAVLIALIRGLARRQSASVGNAWVDLTRATLYVLLPLSLVLAVALVGTGVAQTFSGPVTATLAHPVPGADGGAAVATQTIALGPVASQVAIKQLGTNGGGFFNVNSAHPLENPTPLSNFLQLLAILAIPAALCYTVGRMVRDTRQGWAVFAAMMLLFVPLTVATTVFESGTTPGIEAAAPVAPGGGNMEGKEVRHGIGGSALWAVVTTAASNGSVNSMHDSYTPLGGLIPMWMMQLGEVVFGGVGSGLYGMLVFALLAVFVAGLMVGRTPEYLGKKVEAYEIKMSALVILAPPFMVLIGTALAVSFDAGRATVFNPGAHGFSEVLYAFSSMGNNNGSAFAGLGANVPFYNAAGGLAMLVARFWIIVPVLAIAGSFAAKKTSAATSGTLPTSGPLFVGMLAVVVVVVGALTFVPALALGPIVEHLQMIGH